ncbi:hypothetical protein [Maridesulfovibrio sp.]|uniref:hypothetical protein n=1 Tax=Maridesulfovibrio sp. TaxID=2795000 RepID=UPI0029C9F83D|nr:hypothetical protein [Maridesulfovibrio sp.]
MKKILFLVLILITIFCSGCVEKKIATQNAFYSTQAPSLTIKFPQYVNFIGEESEYVHKINCKRYYYAGEDNHNTGKRLAFFELQTIPPRYYWEPKYLPIGSGPYANVYNKNIDGETYYCRTFITNSNIEKYGNIFEEHGIKIPETMDVMVCTKKISDTKKAFFAYMRQADLAKIDNAFIYDHFDPNALTSKQIHYFQDVDKELSAELIARKFKESDLQ